MSINNQISSLINAFNRSVQNLLNYCNAQIKNINSSNLPISLKQINIQKINVYFTTKYNALKQKLDADIKAAQQQALQQQAAAAAAAAAQQAAAAAAAAAAQQQAAAAAQQAAQQAAAAPKINKKALLIGCNYIGSNNELYGCINDVNNVQNTLKSKYGFNNITLMTDNTAKKPTKANILAEFTSLLQNANSGDVLFFLFSGHGTSTQDKNRDEKDGLDELFVPLDFISISDDEMKALINTKLKQNVTLFALFDSCNSGTVLDLKYQYFDSTNYNNATVNNNETETLGNVFMISGCMDSQTSADAYINKTSQGAMSWAFNDTVNKNPTIAWRDLLATMRTALKTNQYTQIPQLSSGKALDVNAKICLL